MIPYTRRKSGMILLLAWLAYVLSYLGRSNYGACILNIVQETGSPRAMAGMVSSAFFLCYAFGQLAAGVIVRKYPAVLVITGELLLAAAVNLLIPLCKDFITMSILWGMNGAVQSVVLCGLTQIFLENLQEPYLSRSAVLVNTVGAAGGVINYGTTYVILKYSQWKMAFLSAGVVLLLFGVLWRLVMPRLVNPVPSVPYREKIEPKQSSKAPRNSGLLAQIGKSGTAIALIGCFAIGLLREGVTLWIPTYLSDAFGLNAQMSTLFTVFVPLFQILGAFLAGWLGRIIHNLHLPVGLMFAVSGVCLYLLMGKAQLGLVITVTLFVLNAICMTAAMTLYHNLFPMRFGTPETTTLLVGISGFTTHVGSLAASTGIGWLSEMGGWLTAIGILAAISFAASVLSSVGYLCCRRKG